LPVPAGLAGKLTSAAKDIDAAAAAAQARSAELLAIAPVYEEACAAVKALLAAECGKARAYGFEERDRTVRDALSEVLTAAGEHLVGLWLARRVSSYAVEPPRAEQLAKLIIDSPDPEPEPVGK